MKSSSRREQEGVAAGALLHSPFSCGPVRECATAVGGLPIAVSSPPLLPVCTYTALCVAAGGGGGVGSTYFQWKDFS